jgi:Tfp pilus assembly protein PilF
MVARAFAVGVMILTGGAAIAQNLPPGARSVDDHSQQDADNRLVADAETALGRGDYAGAELKLTPIAASHPRDARVQYDLGFAADHNNHDEVATKAYAASIAADDSVIEPKLALGLLEARDRKTKEAHDHLLSAANTQSATRALRARAFRALASLDDGENPIIAQNELLEALKLSPETPADVLLGAELAEQMDEPAIAETAYRRALAQTPGDTEVEAGLARVLMQQKKPAEADTVVTDALKEHPGDPRLVAQAVPIYLAEGDAAKERAEALVPMIEGLRKSDPKFAANDEMSRVLAHLYEAQGDETHAEVLYLELAKKSPNDPTLLDDLGSAQVRLEKYPQAEAVLAKAFAMRKEFGNDDAWADTAEHLAFAASKNKDPQTSLKALAARETVAPDDASSLFLEAISHDTLRQNKDAVASYKAFLAASNGKFPDQEFEARHRLVALQNEK